MLDKQYEVHQNLKVLCPKLIALSSRCKLLCRRNFAIAGRQIAKLYEFDVIREANDEATSSAKRFRNRIPRGYPIIEVHLKRILVLIFFNYFMMMIKV